MYIQTKKRKLPHSYLDYYYYSCGRKKKIFFLRSDNIAILFKIDKKTKTKTKNNNNNKAKQNKQNIKAWYYDWQ